MNNYALHITMYFYSSNFGVAINQQVVYFENRALAEKAQMKMEDLKKILQDISIKATIFECRKENKNG